MINVFKGIIILSLSFSLCNAEINQTIKDESSYIDKIHKSISLRVLEWSDAIDTRLSNWLGDKETNTTDLATNITDVKDNTTIVETNITDLEANITDVKDNITILEGNITILDTNITDIDGNTTILETNTTTVKANTTIIPTSARAVKPNRTMVPKNTTAIETNVPENTLKEEVRSVDQFFQNERYLDETDETYIRVRVENYFESKGSNDFGLNVRAQMPFSKTKKRFRIFIDDLTLDNANDILKDTSETPDIGIHYYASRHKILSRYSIGFSGINPFVKARFNMPIEMDKWLIDPIQTFRYSTDNKFEEETNIYLDRKVDNSSLFRLLLHRKTQDEIDGMDYALSVQYFRSSKNDTGFGLAQSFYGNTKYTYTTEEDVPQPKLKKYGGIHNYVSSFSWRESIWRKWFYYEVRPSVSFHKQYDYEPNYSVRIFFDFYFGKHY